MRITEHSSAAEFSDTPYGRQLLRGFRLLLFKPELEAEFRRFLDRQARGAQRVAALLLIIAVGGYLYAERVLFPHDDPQWLSRLTVLRLVELSPGVLVLLLSFFSKTYQARANQLFPMLLVLIGVVAAIIDIQYELAAQPYAFRYGAGLLIISSFFFLGMTFWHSLLCALSIVAIDVFMASQILPSDRLPEHWIAVSYYLLLLVIGAISRYVHEYSQRQQFLMRKLLGWVAAHDALSELPNRRSHDEALRQRLAQARRDDVPVSLLLLDLDDFKAYNDRLGHPAGDALIGEFARLLASFARRPLDQAARVGGEEFALLLYDCTEDAAQQIASQVLAALRRQAIAHPASAQGRVGVSIGIATLQPGQNAGQLYSAADAALYRAKQAGKNRFAGPDELSAAG
ncbi:MULTISPECIES: diguanylate cyclase [Pseudomonas]|jgi:diguanylate cyclase (GGDEF)-like protein|uniref:GGDEF domain-containing protein n=1 Tax=Pseudomonas TaxID=286 RepID=UPI000988BE30|nr:MULTISPECIES: diguanylate cyclase [Pseudomonas]MCQ4269305.1 GGDEF domain-containing protein [Stutzerimonas degradans]MDT3711518.1 diguanylate cyclase [Pseudomonadaceae bacterium]OOE15562.1 GGDEF domain-containing protein [Stutzerimonas degradans]QGW21162.1 diguanylate cyclase [Stutzerimonas degradans]UIP85707.1 GGDEF domain-containing protein [Pseudomonas phenolilytica]